MKEVTINTTQKILIANYKKKKYLITLYSQNQHSNYLDI